MKLYVPTPIMLQETGPTGLVGSPFDGSLTVFTDLATAQQMCNMVNPLYGGQLFVQAYPWNKFGFTYMSPAQASDCAQWHIYTGTENEPLDKGNCADLARACWGPNQINGGGIGNPGSWIISPNGSPTYLPSSFPVVPISTAVAIANLQLQIAALQNQLKNLQG